MQPPWAIICVSAAGLRLVFRLPVRARCRRASSTSCGVLRAPYTYGRYVAGRVCERVIHVALSYYVSVRR